jgi:hypothetical protein
VLLGVELLWRSGHCISLDQPRQREADSSCGSPTDPQSASPCLGQADRRIGLRSERRKDSIMPRNPTMRETADAVLAEKAATDRIGRAAAAATDPETAAEGAETESVLASALDAEAQGDVADQWQAGDTTGIREDSALVHRFHETDHLRGIHLGCAAL